MSMTTLLGLSFGVFPCLLFGFIMLLSLLICEYIEEYVAKHLCAWKNRRRRGLRSFYHDFRARRNGHLGAVQHYSSRSRSYSSSATWVGGGSGNANSGELMPMPEGSLPFPASAPPSERPVHYGAAQLLSNYPQLPPLAPANDPPPSYEECVLPPRVRLNSANDNSNTNSQRRAVAAPPNKPSSKKSSSTDKEK